ncbi:putative protein kinase UbiB [Posidoniimonas corsicana]|uniref:Protein kinase domain-containing protein n=1 Tax=Posidoniimonas corsicana TaxID=1938618 RepID=A0A5C5UV44_9BACT|nr:AarF/UbiB family protein [Posidoniimonas corsicana]TWT30214.1 putative protein kinase UbiB [Posidoniimonas corsicana]
MKITTIPQLYRNANRWREIVAVLSKYQLAGWLGRFDLPIAANLLTDADGGKIANLDQEARVRRALEELGPTFIKLGQVLSTRPDLVGGKLANELAQLQSSAPADKPEWVRSVIETDLGAPLEELFAEFELKPVASASIGQVHRARLADGRLVAVKVRHERIEERARVDTDILLGLASLAERAPELQNYRPSAVAAEFQRTLLRELDFSHERRRLDQFGGFFEKSECVSVPKPVDQLCSARVLTADWIEGHKVSDAALQNGGADLELVARRGAEAFVKMVFEHGVYHADPHPGNLIVLPGDRVGLIDFGMVGRLSDPLREDLEDMISAIMNNDAQMLTAVVTKVGSTPMDLDEAALAMDVADFVDHYASQPINGLDLSGALHELIGIIRRYQIVLPASMAMLLKLIIMLEGTSRKLSPDFSLLEVLAPQRRKMLMRRYSPARHARKLQRLFFETEALAETLPRRIGNILEQVQSGKFDVHLDHRGLEPSVNRLVLGMMTSALFLGSSLMVSHKVLPINFWPLAGTSAPGLAGCVLAAMLGLRLLRAISKSGRLERRK